jgi:hypothetical protein
MPADLELRFVCRGCASLSRRLPRLPSPSASSILMIIFGNL